MRIEFAPGAFDQFDGTQEELDALVAELERMAESGELEENSVALEDWDDLDDQDHLLIANALENMAGNDKKLH
jgi:DNA-binding GntR family transcriptional regulator